ncbi:transcriptional regulator family protein [Salix suchowensis]|nr:transcriptional regulator family protein [Salix suchowensis]
MVLEELGVIQEKSSSGTAHVLSPSVQATPVSFENSGPSQPGEINDTTNESEAVNTEGANEVPAEGVNPLDKFLPPPPKEKCPEELQAKADMRRDRERRDQELKRSPKVEFVTGITRPGVIVTKFSVPIPAVTASGMLPSSNAAPCEVRQNKKSKWDKVDDDGRNLLTGGQDSFEAAAAAQAALISSANLGRQAAETARQKIKDPEKGSSKEDLEHFVSRFCNESRIYHSGGGQNCS